MQRYILRRLLLAIPTLVLVTIIVFSLVRLLPGSVIDIMFEQHVQYGYAESVEGLKRKLGLDMPIHTQYLSWVWGMLQGDFGESIWTKRTIWQEITLRFPVTLELAALAVTLALLMGIPLGVYSAIRQDTLSDYIMRSVAILGLAAPGFWVATLLLVFGSIWFRWSPPTVFVSFADDPLRNLQMMVPPAIILALHQGAVQMRMTRAMMLEVVRQDYIRTARAKGLQERVLIVRHAIRNAIIPVVTLVGLQIPMTLGGSIIIESIFGLPGMGRFMLEVINMRDYPMLSAVNLFFASIVVVVNLLVDISYAWLDPRIRYA